MNSLNQIVRVRKNQAFAAVGLAFAAGYLWKWHFARSRRFEIPGSRTTIPDELGHYDMDGVSFDDNCGVVVGSDARTPAQVKVPSQNKAGRKAETEKKPFVA